MPALAPAYFQVPGVTVRADGPASPSLLSDLRSDKGMGWLPARGMWFTALTLHAPASTLSYDLSIDGGGPPRGVPFVPPSAKGSGWTWLLAATIGLATAGAVWRLWKPAGPSLAGSA